MWQYQSHRSSREKLLTGAHRALIDCELCCRAQPITRAPGDFAGLEHLHAVCRPIRETTQGEESERDRKRKRKKTKRWGGRVVLVRERGKVGLQDYGFAFSSWWPWKPLLGDVCWSEYASSVLSFAPFVCLESLCLPFSRLSLTSHEPFSRWQYVVCMTFKGMSHGITRRFEHCNSTWHFVKSVLNGQIPLTWNFCKILLLQNIFKKPPDTSWIRCLHSSQRKYPDKIIFFWHKTNENVNRCSKAA